MMGNELFGIDIAGIVADKIAPGLLIATISRSVIGDRDPDNMTAGRSVTPATYKGRGIWEDLPRSPPAGVTFELNDRIALLIQNTVTAPGRTLLRNDAVTIAGATLYVVQLISNDAADAHARYLCRDRLGPDGV